jgi:hypothetical protein
LIPVVRADHITVTHIGIVDGAVLIPHYALRQSRF